MAYDHATAAALLLMAFPTLSDGTADRPCELHEDGVFLSEEALLHKAILRRVTPNPRRSYATATV